MNIERQISLLPTSAISLSRASIAVDSFLFNIDPENSRDVRAGPTDVEYPASVRSDVEPAIRKM